MNIAIIGLGLIGGSFAKAIKKHTTYFVGGFDILKSTISSAITDNAIDKEITSSDLQSYDYILISLYPKDTIAFLKENYSYFSATATVIDLCGVKKPVCDFAKEIFSEKGPFFIGGHPMAGREYSGYQHATPDLFQNASMILTPGDNLPIDILKKAEELFLELGFRSNTITTPEHHDQIIAYTSQMAHVVSNAYMQSPTAKEFMGFSAGSFADLTRVAKLNEDMWVELFLANTKPLVKELDLMVENISEMRDYIKEGNINKLREKLKHGREMKEYVNLQKEKEK